MDLCRYYQEQLPPGRLANSILNPLTTIKGYLQLGMKNNRYLLNEEILRLLLSEVAKVEEEISAIEEGLKRLKRD